MLVNSSNFGQLTGPTKRVIVHATFDKNNFFYDSCTIIIPMNRANHDGSSRAG